MEFINKQLALKLKEKGFNRPCFGWYYINTPSGRNEGELILNTSKTRGVAYEDLLCSHNENFIEYVDNYVDAPTIEQTLKWLREEKKIYVGILYMPKIDKKNDFYFLSIHKIGNLESPIYNGDTHYFSYEDAALAGIEYVINNLLN